MALSLKDAAFALDTTSSSLWSLRSTLSNRGIWPPLKNVNGISCLEFAQRFSAAGAELRKFANDTTNIWTHMPHATVIDELRERLRDPAILRQSKTSLCGPYALMVEMVRRNRAHYVKTAAQLMSKGTVPVFHGDAIVADSDLRGRESPVWVEISGKDIEVSRVGKVDWMISTTIREDENVSEDIQDGGPQESFTLPGAMERWVRDLLNLKSELFECYHEDELEALQVARRAVEAGGVAFMLIDANLISDGSAVKNDKGVIVEEAHAEEDMHWQQEVHTPLKPVGSLGKKIHSKDDTAYGLFGSINHWVVFLGGLQPSNPRPQDQITLKLWSWGREFTMTGSAASFGEYLYAVVAGTP